MSFPQSTTVVSLLTSRRASVSLMAVGFLITMLSIGAFTVQIATLYVTKMQYQRASDLASQAAAMTPSAVVGGAASATAQATAKNIFAINGFGGLSSSINAVLQSSGSYAIAASLSNNFPLIFGGLLGKTASATTAVGTLGSATPVTTTISDCVASLTGAVSITGTASLTGSGCGIGAQTGLSLSGSSVNVSSVAVGDDAYTETPLATGAATLSPAVTAFTFKATTTDALASSASVAAITSHLNAMSSWPYGTTIPVSPISPSVTAGTNQTYPSGTTATLPEATKYGSLTITSSTLTFSGNSGTADPNCTSPTTISGGITLNGSSTLTFKTGCYVIAGGVTASTGSGVNTFAVATGATVTFVFEGDINNNSTGNLTFGPASYSFDGNINENQGSTISFGAGTKAFSPYTIDAGWGFITFGDGNYYLSSTTVLGGNNSTGGTTTFGNGNFYAWNAAITNRYWSTMKFGNGTYYFYNTAVTNGTTDMASMTFGNGAFYFNGGALTNGTSSALTFGTGVMDFYGTTVNVGAPTSFGSGGSTTTGGATVSMNGGALNVTSGGSLLGTGVTLAIKSTNFNVSAPLYIQAPTAASPNYAYTNLALVSTNEDLTLSGITAHITGMIYAPQNTVTISGSSAITDTESACLGVDAAYVTMSGSASFAAVPCSGVMPTSSGTSPVLTQ